MCSGMGMVKYLKYFSLNLMAVFRGDVQNSADRYRSDEPDGRLPVVESRERLPFGRCRSIRSSSVL